jgi:putative flippase GtrA
MAKTLNKHKQLVRYIAVGVTAYAFELIVLYSLFYFIGLSAVVSTAISFWISIFTSFFLQKIFAFKNYQREINTVSKQFALYGF